MEKLILASCSPRRSELLTQAGIPFETVNPDVNEECDYHRIILHYVYLNIENSQRKTDNYIHRYPHKKRVSVLFCAR